MCIRDRYKAKLIIDTFFVRTGDLLSAGVVLVGSRFLSLSVRQFAPVNLMLAGAWLAVAIFVARQNRTRSEQHENPRGEVAL